MLVGQHVFGLIAGCSSCTGAGQEKTGSIDITVMKDSMMNMGPEPYPVHIKFTGTARIVGANNVVTPDLNPANDQVTTVTITANPV